MTKKNRSARVIAGSMLAGLAGAFAWMKGRRRGSDTDGTRNQAG